MLRLTNMHLALILQLFLVAINKWFQNLEQHIGSSMRNCYDLNFGNFTERKHECKKISELRWSSNPLNTTKKIRIINCMFFPKLY